MIKHTFKDLCSIKTGKLDANAAVENGAYPFFTCSKKPLKINTYAYDCDCILLAGNGEFNVNIYSGKFNAYQRTYIIQVNDSEKTSLKYLFYLLKHSIAHLKNVSTGGVIKFIKLGNIQSITVPEANIKIQHKISMELDRLQNAINLKKQQLASLDDLVKSRFIEMFGDPITNSKNLPELTLPELGEFGRGVSKHRPRNAPELLGGKYPLIQTGEVANAELYINGYTNTYSELGYKQSKMWKAGTLCITIAANIAKTGILSFDACFPDSVVGFHANEKTNNIFIHFWFTFFQEILEAQAPASAQKNINLRILSELKVIVPPIELQNEFADFVKLTDKSKFIVQKQIEDLQELLDSKMDEYFG